MTTETPSPVPPPRPRRRVRRVRRLRFRLPAREQLALLDLPAVADFIEGRRREVIVNLAEKLIAAGGSQNRTAALLNVPVVTLFAWRKRFREGGAEALIPRRREGGRRPAPGKPRPPLPCSIQIYLRAA